MKHGPTGVHLTSGLQARRDALLGKHLGQADPLWRISHVRDATTHGDGRMVSKALELTGQGIRFDVAGAGSVGEGEIKPGEEEGPLCLSGIESLSSSDVLQVLVVSPNQEGLLGSLQPVLPFL